MSHPMLIDLEPIAPAAESTDQPPTISLKLAIQTDALKKAVAKVEGSISKRAVQEIYKTIYVEIRNSMIIFRGVNSSHMAEAIIRQNEDKTNFSLTSGNGATLCFPGDKFLQIIKSMKGETTQIKIDGHTAKIKSSSPWFTLQGMASNDFPLVPSLQDGVSLTIDSHLLGMVYDRTMYAASTKETRPILTGVNHVLSGNQFKCVATDSHRLAQYACEIREELPEISTTVPATTMAEVKKLMDKTEGNVSIFFYDNRIVYAIGDATIYAQVLEGTFPATDRLIAPTEVAGSRITVNVGAILELLSGSTVFNPNQPIIIRVKPEENQVRINTREAEVGEFQADLAVTDGFGADLTVGVNVRYLQDALARYSSDDNIVLEFRAENVEKNLPVGLQPFQGRLANGNPDCVQLFVPVRSPEIDYDGPVFIDNFQGLIGQNFNAFDAEFEGIE